MTLRPWQLMKKPKFMQEGNVKNCCSKPMTYSVIRMKDVRQEKYTQEEADRGAGKTAEKLPPAHPELARARSAAAMEQS